MTMTLTQIEKEAFKLPADQQMRLVSDICCRQAMTDQEREDLRVVHERIKRIDSGVASTIDGTNAIAGIRSELMRRR